VLPDDSYPSGYQDPGGREKSTKTREKQSVIIYFYFQHREAFMNTGSKRHRISILIVNITGVFFQDNPVIQSGEESWLMYQKKDRFSDVISVEML
jgi:hypothetical protein